jgi:hypothetical protein
MSNGAAETVPTEPGGTKTEIPRTLDARLAARVLEEGYGPGAWHGADFKAALADVTSEMAFWRPARGRHNIAESALHHAYCVRNVRAQVSGAAAGTFVLAGEDWFTLDGPRPLGWSKVQAVVADEQAKLAAAVAAGTAALSDAERFELALGVTCHAIYHAGQVQLIKRLYGGRR